MITPPRIVGVRVRVVHMIIAHKVRILLGGSSCEDYLTISIDMPINSAYLIVEYGGGNPNNVGWNNRRGRCNA